MGTQAKAQAQAQADRFRGVPHYLDAAAGEAGDRAAAAKARGLAPLDAVRHHVIQAGVQARRGGPSGAAGARSNLKLAEHQVRVLEVALGAARGMVADARRAVDLRVDGGETMAEKEREKPTGSEKRESGVDPAAGLDPQRLPDPGAPPVSGQATHDPGTSNIGAARAGHQVPADTAAENVKAAQRDAEMGKGDPAAGPDRAVDASVVDPKKAPPPARDQGKAKRSDTAR